MIHLRYPVTSPLARHTLGSVAVPINLVHLLYIRLMGEGIPV